MNYWRCFGSDLLGDTADLSLAEQGALHVLLHVFYCTERPLPAAERDLYRLTRASTAAERKAVARVAARFFPVSADDDLRHNRRADAELARGLKLIAVAKANGARGGRPRASGYVDDNAVGDEPARNPAGSPPDSRGVREGNSIGSQLGAPSTKLSSSSSNASSKPSVSCSFGDLSPALASEEALRSVWHGDANAAKCSTRDREFVHVCDAVSKTLEDRRHDALFARVPMATPTR